MHTKATIVAYAFSVQCFENAIIVAYADYGLMTDEIKHIASGLYFNACKWDITQVG